VVVEMQELLELLELLEQLIQVAVVEDAVLIVLQMELQEYVVNQQQQAVQV
tara:strand:- start:26 stop:178 length:153 start_codon:yes stop_codon:yes gene_type:complete